VGGGGESRRGNAHALAEVCLAVCFGFCFVGGFALRA
jgi:hypothetical protein